MKTRKLLFAFVSVLVSTGQGAPAQADDRCSDVLKGGAFQRTDYRQRDYFQQIILARFVSASYADSRTNKDLGFGVPIGELVMGGNYNEAEFEQRKAEIRRSLNVSTIASHELDVALTSGDPTIVEAWRDCMSKKSGLSIRFEPFSSTQVTATIEWFAPPGLPTQRLSADFKVPQGITILSNGGCFKKDTIFKDRVPCVVLLQLPDARTTLGIALMTEAGAASAFLPPRLKQITDRKPYPFSDNKRRVATAGYAGSKRPSIDIEVTQQDRRNGWRLDTASVRTDIVVDNAVDNGVCRDPVWRADSYRAHFEYTWLNNNDHQAQQCALLPSADLVRDRWVPVDSIQTVDERAQ
jgi:hypothetical protein